MAYLCVTTGTNIWADQEQRIEYHAPEQIAQLALPALKESSGLAPSRIDDQLLYSHNDSGGQPRLFAFSTRGKTMGVHPVTGAKARDWEDMASFKTDGQPYLLIADTGDNRRVRKSYRLYRVPEPTLGQPFVVDQVVTFTFKTGPCDCEAIAFDTQHDLVLLVDKGWTLQCRLFGLKWPKKNEQDAIAQPIATLPIAGITGMDLSPDNLRLIVSTYGPAYEYCRAPNESWREALKRDAREIPLPARRQGEAICYGADGRSIFVTSEKVPTPLFRLAAPPNPLTAPPAANAP